jgi:enoyl-CoA hydratase/carnithine racemase
MSDALLLETHGPIRTITFNRPAQRNSLPPAEWLHLRDILGEIAADREARAIVIRGAGGRAVS